MESRWEKVIKGSYFDRIKFIVSKIYLYFLASKKNGNFTYYDLI